MKIRLTSDLHLEFDGEWDLFDIPILEDEKSTVLVLAGDITTVKTFDKLRNFISRMSERFQAIVMIAGNHEFYHSDFNTARLLIKRELAEYRNVHYLEKSCLHLEGLTFVGATLWTDFEKHNLDLMRTASTYMNDYNLITCNDPNEVMPFQRLDPQNVYDDHLEAKEYIFEAIKTAKRHENQIVVVTHHGPTLDSIDPEYVSSDLNGAYVSDLRENILYLQPDLWIHGHTHRSQDYMVGETRVVCNPRGYAGHDVNPRFDPELTIEL